MKVTDVRENPEKKYITEIKVGTVFEYDNEFYIKIPHVRHATSDMMYNAIRLSDGIPFRAPIDRVLTIPYAEVLIS